MRSGRSWPSSAKACPLSEITATLAAWIPTLTFEALPPRARSRAKLAIFDACGTALAGTHHPAVQHLRQLMAEMGSTPQARHQPSPPP